MHTQNTPGIFGQGVGLNELIEISTIGDLGKLQLPQTQASQTSLVPSIEASGIAALSSSSAHIMGEVRSSSNLFPCERAGSR